MNFVRSRLLLVAVVLSVPALQVVACGQKDRQYVVMGTGGDNAANGGTPDTTEGGEPGKSGNSTGGVPNAEGGSISSGGGGDIGGSSGGGDAAGGPSTGGTDMGEGGGGTIIDGGGAGGEPNVDPGCVPNGKEVCTDGVDNDCNGETDCLVLRSQFPHIDHAAPGSDVRYTFNAPHASAAFQCRSSKGLTATSAWGDCPGAAGGAVTPFTTAQSMAAANNGVWTTEVRLAFPDGGTSAPFRRQVYIHSSMHGAARCVPGVTDEAFFTAAKPNLQDAGVFDTSTVKAPFISLDFDPPVNATFAVAATDGDVNLMSLRRRFSFSADNKYLLITRNYSSKKADGMGCTAIEKRVHNRPGSWAFGNMSYQRCTGIVLNKKGAGFCLSVTGNTVAAAEHVRADGGVQTPSPTYSPKADNFAWRKLTGEMSPGISVNFSKKCFTAGCGNATTLFLPDASLFAYWGG